MGQTLARRHHWQNFRRLLCFARATADSQAPATSVVAAIFQISKGKIIIIADQTGIGKGRQAAAIIRWGMKHGKIPVFMTLNDKLFNAIYNDLVDIGSIDVRPFIINADGFTLGRNTHRRLCYLFIPLSSLRSVALPTMRKASTTPDAHRIVRAAKCPYCGLPRRQEQALSDR